MTHGSNWQHGMSQEKCGCGGSSQVCPSCGRPGHESFRGHGGKGRNMKHMVFWAYKKALMTRIEEEIATRHGEKLDETAKELVDIAEDKMKMKADFGQRMNNVFENMMGGAED